MGFTAGCADRQVKDEQATKSDEKVRSTTKRSGQTAQGAASAARLRGDAASRRQASASNMAHFLALSRDLDRGLPVRFGGPQGLPR
jgi:hypothetical protein